MCMYVHLGYACCPLRGKDDARSNETGVTQVVESLRAVHGESNPSALLFAEPALQPEGLSFLQSVASRDEMVFQCDRVPFLFL